MSNPLVMIRRRRGAILGVLLLCVVVFVAGVMLQRRSLAQQKAQADGRARTTANEVGALLHGNRLDKQLDAVTTARLQNHAPHAPIIAERVWTTSGTLRFSSLSKDHSPPIMDLLKPATKGSGHVESSYDGNVITTYSPLHNGLGAKAYGAVEVQQSYVAVLAAAATPWTSIRTAATVVGALMLLLLLIGAVSAIPGRRAAKKGGGFVAQDDPSDAMSEAAPRRVREDPAVAKAAAQREQAQKAQAEQAIADKAKAEAEKRATDEELTKLKEQLRSDHERAGARIEELSGELERVNMKLQEAQVAAAAAAVVPVVDPSVVEQARELEQSLAEERHRSTTAETRATELQTELDQAQLLLGDSSADVETLGAEVTDLRANVERLGSELGSALERAREAEDLAASFQDRLTAMEAAAIEAAARVEPAREDLVSPFPDDDPLESLQRESVEHDTPLDAWAARQPDTSEDEEMSADDLRSRLTRAAARKRGHNQGGDPEWP